jgi:hypothetical protein
VRESLEIQDQRLGAMVEPLVEAVDGRLIEQPYREPLAVGAAQLHLPVRRRGLLPLDGVHEHLLASRADVHVLLAAGGYRRGLGRPGRIAVEVDDVDRAAGRQHQAANVICLVSLAHGVSRRGLMGSSPYIGP